MSEKLCDLCEVSYRVSAYWTCIDCVKHLCDVCKDVHNKIPICMNHVIVPLTSKLNIYGENVGEDYYQVLDSDTRQEEKHVRGNDNDLRTVFEETEDQHKKLLGHLLHLKEETIPYLVGQLNGTRRNREAYTRHVERVVGEITKKAESLKTDVENIRDHLLRALKDQENEDFAKLSRYEAILNRKLAALREHVNVCEKTMKNKGESEKTIVDRISKIKVDMDETIKAIRKPTRIFPPKFLTTKLEPTTMEGAYGYLESTEDTDVQVNDTKSDSYSSYSYSRASKFSTNDKVCCIATNIGEAWLGHPSSVDCVTIDGHVLKKILVPKCTSIGVLESQDELVLVTKNGKFAKVLRTGTRNLMYIDTAFFRAIALCVTSKDEVLVCFMRTTASRKELETSTFVVGSKISRFSSKCTGKATQEIVLDTLKVSNAVIKTSSRRRVPCYVKENLNRDICSIVEIQGKNTNKIERAVLVMNQQGKTRFYYRGADDQDDFDPTCLACDLNAHILVCDKDRVHLLNADGQFLRFLMTFNDHLHTIHCLDCDKIGRLWMSVTKRESHESTVWVFKRV